MKFSELQLNENVLEALDAMRFDECTPKPFMPDDEKYSYSFMT